MSKIVTGLCAGAVGTLALEVSTYADMLLRGRPSSEAPADLAEKLADRLGISLGDGEASDNRKSALGALLGYSTGLAIGAMYGLVGRGRHRPVPLTGLVLGATAMAAADVPLVIAGIAKPGDWKAVDWLADAVPHAVYGVATAAMVHVFDRPRRRFVR
jgi:hypothetical protein